MIFILRCLLLISILSGCAPWKSSQKSQGDYTTAIENAIIDFSESSSLAKDDTVFSIGFNNLQDGLIGVSIFGAVNKFLVTEDRETDITMFPTRYYEYSNKLFYWTDPNSEVTSEILIKLDQYNQIDSLPSIAFAELVIDDGKKGMLYYFCGNDLLQYKKVKADVNRGWYDDLPNLNCN